MKQFLQLASVSALLLSFAIVQADDEPPKVGDTAPNLELKTYQGKDVSLKESLKKGPAVVVVLRGFPGYQ